MCRASDNHRARAVFRYTEDVYPTGKKNSVKTTARFQVLNGFTKCQDNHNECPMGHKFQKYIGQYRYLYGKTGGTTSASAGFDVRADNSKQLFSNARQDYFYAYDYPTNQDHVSIKYGEPTVLHDSYTGQFMTANLNEKADSYTNGKDKHWIEMWQFQDKKGLNYMSK